MLIRPLIVTSVLLSVASTPSHSGELVDSVLANVGSEVILYSDIMSAIGGLVVEIERTSKTQAEYNRRIQELVDEALEESIESKLLYREAQKKGLRVPEEAVEGEIDRVRKLYPPGKFEELLKEAGETMSDYRDKTRKKILAMAMSSDQVAKFEKDAVVSETEVSQFYEEYKEEFLRSERMEVRQIMLRVNSDQTARKKAATRLQLLKEEIEAGADFGDLARLHSQATGAEDGGTWGWVERGDLHVKLEEAVFSTEIGTLSDVVMAQFGVHLFIADNYREAGYQELDEARSIIEPELRARAAADKYETWYQDLRKRSQVREYKGELYTDPSTVGAKRD